MTASSPAVAPTGPARADGRPRNPRGHGDRLRQDILNAALELITEHGSLAGLSLRAVARRAGITAPSIYRHFPDLDHLAAAVIERCFAELAAARADPRAQAGDPVAVLKQRLRGYVDFALAHPGYYQVMFGPDPLPGLATDYQHSPRRATFDSLVAAVARCQPPARTDHDCWQTATLLWAAAHGLAALRISRPNFPWPALGPLIDTAADRLLAIPATQ